MLHFPKLESSYLLFHEDLSGLNQRQEFVFPFITFHHRRRLE